jgi:hypothetical protein
VNIIETVPLVQETNMNITVESAIYDILCISIGIHIIDVCSCRSIQ